MHINERLDEGDLLLQEPLEVAAGEHAPALTQRLAERGAPLLVRTLRELKSGSIRATPQAHELATYAPILKREHGYVDPSQMPAAEIEGAVRGFDPWPGVWLMHEGQRLRLHVVREIDHAGNSEVGHLTHLSDDRWALRCASETWLQIDEVQLQGRRRLPIADVIRGRQLQDGARLEAICER
jgi:methionyl-tRNA formyltransferase